MIIYDSWLHLSSKSWYFLVTLAFRKSHPMDHQQFQKTTILCAILTGLLQVWLLSHPGFQDSNGRPEELLELLIHHRHS